MNMREYLSREARRMQAAALRSLPPVAQWPAERVPSMLPEARRFRRIPDDEMHPLRGRTVQ